MNVLIVGAGPAGITVAERLRAADRAIDITLLSAEPYPPYSPPALADHFLTGRDEPLFWKGRDVDVRLALDYQPGTAVQTVRPASHEVALADGTQLGYDRLVIATGSRLHAPVPGWDLPGVLDFKSLTMATAIVDRVRHGRARSALIVGAGFIGVEIALLLADLGVDVTIVGRRGWVMPRTLDLESGEITGRVLAARGVTLALGVEAERFFGSDGAEGIELADGRVLRADLLVAATGVKPNVDALEGSGIDVHWGVRVDDRLRTTVPDVWAAGDVVEARDRLTGEAYVHAIFPNAVEQAAVVADDLLGRPAHYPGAESMNSLKHLGLPLLAAGAAEGADELRSRRGDELRKVFLRDGRIVGFRLVGDIRGAGTLRTLMLRNEDVRRFGRRILDPRFGIGDLIFDAVAA